MIVPARLGRYVRQAEVIIKNSNTNLLHAHLLMLTAIVAFTSMAVSGRYASIELNTFEVIFYQSLIGVLFVSS